VRLRAIDVDAMPIEQSRAEIEFRFGNKTVPVNWNRGSNEYVASVPDDLTAQPGLYALVVTANEAWNETAGQNMRCELLSRTIEVTSVVSVQAIIYGAVAGALLLILGVVAIYMASMHRHRVTQLFVSFLRGETLLTLKILMELIDISGDSNPLPRFLRLHSPSG
jgi:hypothetical protein